MSCVGDLSRPAPASLTSPSHLLECVYAFECTLPATQKLELMNLSSEEFASTPGCDKLAGCRRRQISQAKAKAVLSPTNVTISTQPSSRSAWAKVQLYQSPWASQRVRSGLDVWSLQWPSRTSVADYVSVIVSACGFNFPHVHMMNVCASHNSAVLTWYVMEVLTLAEAACQKLLFGFACGAD